MIRIIFLPLILCLMSACVSNAGSPGETTQSYDVIIRNGIIYDGTGSEGQISDLAISGDKIVNIFPRLPG